MSSIIVIGAEALEKQRPSKLLAGNDSTYSLSITVKNEEKQHSCTINLPCLAQGAVAYTVEVAVTTTCYDRRTPLVPLHKPRTGLLRYPGGPGYSFRT